MNINDIHSNHTTMNTTIERHIWKHKTYEAIKTLYTRDSKYLAYKIEKIDNSSRLILTYITHDT